MNMVDMVVLTNSRKRQGRCVAGLWLNEGSITGTWIRPISSHGSGELYDDDRRSDDGNLVELLDVVRVPLTRRVPGCHQPENIQIEAGASWQKVGELSAAELGPLVEQPSDIWLAASSSTYVGLRDRVPHLEADKHVSSLVLIRVDSLSLEVLAPSANFGDMTRRVYGTFTYADEKYILRITDVDVEHHYVQLGDGFYTFGSAYIVVSVAEEYKGDCYKLIATAIPVND